MGEVLFTGIGHRKQFDLRYILSRKYSFSLPFGCNLVIPTETRGTEEIFHDFQEIAALDNKSNFKAFCMRKGLPTLAFQVGRIERPGEYIVKPYRGSGSVGIYRKFFTVGEEIKEDYYAEQIASGPTFGAGIIYRSGRVVDVLFWQRMLTFPRSGGPSVIARIIYDDRLDSLVARFSSSLSSEPTGAFMLEFIEDASGELFFLEVNPRIWGSVALMECGGHNFLQDLVASLYEVELKVENDELSRLDHFINPVFAPLDAMRMRRRAFLSGVTFRTPAEALSEAGRYLSADSAMKLVKKLGWKK